MRTHHSARVAVISAFTFGLVGFGLADRSRAADPVAVCSEHLAAIDKALGAYQREHGDLPGHLSDLHPKYLPDLSVLHCPADATAGEPFNAFFPPPWRLPDPKRPVSYLYLYADTSSPPLLVDLGPPGTLAPNATLRQRMIAHRVQFGAAVPLAQCPHHPGSRLDLFPGGRVFRSEVPLFENDPHTYPHVLKRLEADVAKGRQAVERKWSIPAVEEYFLDWAGTPLPPADHGRLASVAEGLANFADQLPAAARPAAWRLVARFDGAGNRFDRALRGARRAADLGGADDAAARYLVGSLQYRAGGRSADPPVDAYLAWQSRRRHLPGISVAVMREGKPVYLKGLGFADLEHQAPATPQTVYRIASMTKTFVGTALMMLVEEGKVSLDESVTKYLTDAPKAWEKITVRHLVTHTSGLGDIWDVPPALRPAVIDGGQIVKMVAALPAPFAPGERYQYNHGATLVGVAIERVTGKPLGQFLKEQIFDPLGMTATRVDEPRRVTKGRARNYGWDDAAGTWVNAEPLAWNVSSLADGGMVSTVEDLAKWDAALYGDRLLKAATRREMWTPTRLGDGTVTAYGCGWQLGDVRGHRWVGHFGAGQTSTRISRFVGDKLTIVALCNFDRGDAPRLVDDLAALCLPPAPPLDDPDPESTARLKVVLAGLAAGRAAAASDAFDADAASALSSQAAATARFYRSLGALKSFHFIGQDDRGPAGRTRRFGAEFDRGRWVHYFGLNGDGKVVSLTAQTE